MKKRVLSVLLVLVMVVSIITQENPAIITYAEETGNQSQIVPGESPAGNLLDNGNFSEGMTSWRTVGTGTFADGKYTVDINDIFQADQDWTNCVVYAGTAVTFEAGKSYEVTYDILSTASRSVMSSFDPGRQDPHIEKLTADEVKHVSYTLNPSATTSEMFAIYLGKIAEEDVGIGSHTIQISNISIVDMTSGNTPSPSPEATPDTGATPDPETTPDPGEDVTPVEPVPGNLLVNGNLASNSDGWSFHKDLGTVVTAKPYKVVFDIKENMADWQTSMHQTVDSVEIGTEYLVSFDVLSSVDRTVIFGFDGKREAPSAVIPANVKTTITYSVVATTKSFMIYLGTDVGAHKVEISNVSLLPKPETFPSDENEPAVNPVTSLAGIDFSKELLLKNGSFTGGSDGLEGWSHYEVDWMKQYNVVKYSKAAEGLKVWIKNFGDGAGNYPYDAKIYQTIIIPKEKNYRISFDVHSEKARCIQIALDGRGNQNIMTKTIGIQKNETVHASYNIPAQAADTPATFSVLMGNIINKDVLDNTLTFSNMKIELSGLTELSEIIDDGDFTGGIGEFTTEGDAVFDADTEKSMTVAVNSAGALETVSLNRNIAKLEAGQAYDVSFVAGARAAREIKAVIENGAGNVLAQQSFQLTTDPARYRMQFIPAEDAADAVLKLQLGGTADTLYLDTIRMDASGFVQAAGINTEAHDITGLMKEEAPVFSEDNTDACVGNDIVLTFPDNSAYRSAVESVTVAGREVYGTAECILKPGELVLDQSLFTIDAADDRKIFEIVIKAAWYKDVVLRQTIYAQNMWNLTWSDEFDGTGSDLDTNNLDLSKWSYQDGTGAEFGVPGWGNDEQQYYTKDNIIVEDGVLKIKATKEERSGKPYSSGRIWTMSDDKTTPLFSQRYGKFEAKIKMPGGDGCQGLWPAFWMLPADDSEYGGWPLSGELDIMEARGREPDKVDGTIHYGQPYPNNQAIGGHYVWEEGTGSINDYHVYSVEWDPGEIRWYMDGELYYTQNNWYSLPDGAPSEFAYPAPFDQPFYIILNLAVGGTYDNNHIPDDSALPAEMLVDYVRAYEYKGEYKEPVKPEIPKDEVPAEAKQPDADGDYIVDKQFNNVTVINDGSVQQDKTGWNFATLPEFKGAAVLSKEPGDDGSTMAKIEISNAGTAAHSVQLIQNVPLVKGRYYKISFDAYAEKSRPLAIKFGDTGDDGWGTYGSYSPVLSTEPEHYESVFQMTNDTDITSRIEFNLGLNTTSVWIGNVSFMEVDGKITDTDAAKKPLEDGNHIYNGTFGLGEGRMVYWNKENLDASVIYDQLNGYVLKMNTSAGNGQRLYQQGIELLQSDTYTLTFDASASVARTLEVLFTDKTEQKVYARQELMLNSSWEQKKYTFTMPEGVTDKEARIIFMAGGADSTVYMDDIRLVRDTNKNVDFQGVNCYPLTNGDFESGSAGWSTYGASMTVEKDGENNIAKATGAAGGNNYDSLLMYANLDLYGKFTYTFSFRAKANKNAEVEITMEDANYTRLFSNKINVSTEWQTYTYETKFSTDCNLTLKYMLGGTGSPLEFYLDDVVLEMKGAPKRPGTITMYNTQQEMGTDVVLNYKGEDAWISGAQLYLDGEELPEEMIAKAAGTITLSKDAFPYAKEYTLEVRAAGYSNYNVKLRIYSSDGNVILNGTFDHGLNAWETYAHNDCADYKVENGYLSIHSRFKANEGGNPVNWSVQAGQSNIPVIPNKEYELTFVGYSTIERQIVLEGINNREVTLTTKPQLFKVAFKPENFDLNLKFLMGTVGNLGDVDHYIYLDNISIKEKTGDEPGGGELPEGSKLEAPMNVFIRNAEKGVEVTILPALNTPEGASYAVYFDEELVTITEDTLYLYETTATGEHKIQVKVICGGYQDSDLTEMVIVLGDSFPPEIPADFKVVSRAVGTIELVITPPYDNVGVAGYIIYLDGSVYKDITEASYILTGIEPGEHLISLKAYDAAGNISGMSVGRSLYVTGQTTGGGSQGGGSIVVSVPSGPLDQQWQQALDQIKGLEENKDGKKQELTQIVIKNNAILPRDVVEGMINRPVQLAVEMNGYKWLIKGSTIQDEKIGKEYNLRVRDLEGREELMELKSVVDKAVKEQKVKELNIIRQFEIGHKGGFPFEAVLVLPTDKKYGGSYLYVYYSNEESKELELAAIVKADKSGEIQIPFRHASTYIITEQPVLKPSAASSKTIYTTLGGKMSFRNTAEDAVITYKTSNKAIAAVSKSGVLTGKKAGTATITSTIKQGGKTYTLKTKVTVKKGIFRFNKKTDSLKVSKSYTFTVTSQGYPKDVVWSTTDTSIAAITQKGKLTARKAGTVTVCATVDGKTIVQKVKITK